MNDVLNKLLDAGEGAFSNFKGPLLDYVPTLLVALGLLIVGWLAAIVISQLVAWAINKSRLDELLSNSLGIDGKGKSCPVTDSIKTITFYTVMLFAIIQALDKLSLTVISQPLNVMFETIFAFAPSIIGAIGLMAAGWGIATLTKWLINTVLTQIKLDDLLSSTAGKKGSVQVVGSIAETSYWLIMLFFLPLVLATLGLNDVIGPLNNMFNELLGHLPNIFSAGVILAVGWLVAKIVQRVVSNLLSSVGIDQFAETIGLSSIVGKTNIADVLSLVVYVLILFSVITQALAALSLNALVAPATGMLNSIVAFIPSLFAAMIMLAIAVIVGRFASNMVANLLQTVGFDNVMSWLAISNEKPKDGARPSDVVSKLVLGIIILFASIEACNMLGLTSISALLVQFLNTIGSIIVGLIILAVGLALSNLAASTISSSASHHAELLATIARVAIIVLATAMGLREMGLANDIINMAFGYLIGAIAVAVALAFGLGCKDIAAKEVEKWLKSL